MDFGFSPPLLPKNPFATAVVGHLSHDARVTESIAGDQELGVAGLREIIGRAGTSPDAILEQLGETCDDVTLVAVRRVCYPAAPKMKADAMPTAVFTSAGTGRDQD